MFRDLPSFLSIWPTMRARTLRVLEALPEEHLEWSPGPGHWTFGDLFRHLAGLERWMWAENLQGRPSRYPGHGPGLAAGLPGVRAYLDRCHGESLAIFSALSEADLARDCTTPAGTALPGWKWLRAMMEHEAHHRGQLYLMAGLRGVAVAPLFGLTEEEVAARSSRMA